MSADDPFCIHCLQLIASQAVPPIGSTAYDALIAPLVIFVVVMFVIYQVQSEKRERAAIETWTREQGIRLLNVDRSFRIAAIAALVLRGHRVYEITAAMPDGEIRKGRAVRVASFFAGKYRVKVRWQEVQHGFPVVTPGASGREKHEPQ